MTKIRRAGFFSAPPEGIVPPFQLLLSTFNLRSFFACDSGAENVTFAFRREAKEEKKKRFGGFVAAGTVEARNNDDN